ncbi:TetR/AcrR family transcriptional regulator [Vallicoccus soli]|uniref:TetR/AcrR family transcriptional regulator n=1 Tax=Vallicoccus soli TaxID=2339232 RepID=UPI0015AE6D64|nr:TetR/AcrR family transcriptional regulator [Vallicoccus soli]
MARPRTTSDDEVFAATARVVRRHGPAGTTLAAVAREAGLSASGLVQRFGSKRALLLAFSERAEEATAACFAGSRAHAASALDALHGALGALVADLDGRDELANDLGFLLLDLRDEDFRRHATANALRTEAEIAGLLAEAVQEGDLSPGTDTGALARSLYVAYNGALVLWPLVGRAPLPEELHAALDAVLLPHRTDRPTPPPGGRG